MSLKLTRKEIKTTEFFHIAYLMLWEIFKNLLCKLTYKINYYYKNIQWHKSFCNLRHFNTNSQLKTLKDFLWLSSLQTRYLETILISKYEYSKCIDLIRNLKFKMLALATGVWYFIFMFSDRFLLITADFLESSWESESFLNDVYITFPMNIIHRKLQHDKACYCPSLWISTAVSWDNTQITSQGLFGEKVNWGRF